MRIIVIEKKVAIIVCLSLLVIAACIPFCMDNVLPASGQSRELPIYRVDKEEKEIAITFDSAWGNEDLGQIMDTLDQYNCRATFFIVGDFIKKYPDDVKELSERGHEIANHSYSHAHFNALSRESMIKDMDKCDELIKQITGKDNNLFRAPYGEYNTLLVKTCAETNRFIIQWDVDSLDWRGLTPEQMEKRVFDKVRPGSIILFHNGTKHTAVALPQILNRLKNEGYIFKTVSELIYKENYVIDHAGMQSAI